MSEKTPPSPPDKTPRRRRVVVPDPPGVDTTPSGLDGDEQSSDHGANDQRLREDKPPHY